MISIIYVCNIRISRNSLISVLTGIVKMQVFLRRPTLLLPESLGEIELYRKTKSLNRGDNKKTDIEIDQYCKYMEGFQSNQANYSSLYGFADTIYLHLDALTNTHRNSRLDQQILNDVFTVVQSTSKNSSSRCNNHYLRYCSLKYVILMINVIISIVTIFGNILVILAFHLDRRIRHPSNLFICSLAVSDCLIGVFSMPILASYIFNNQQWPLNSFMCNVWLSLDYSLCLTSIYNVLFITIDRFCSVKFPTKYTKFRTKRRIEIIIYCSWILPALIFISSTFAYPAITHNSNYLPETGQCDVRWKDNKLFNVLLTVVYFWVTLLVMIVLYIMIYFVARNLARRTKQTANLVSSMVNPSKTMLTDTVKSLSNFNMNKRTYDDEEEEDESSTTANDAFPMKYAGSSSLTTSKTQSNDQKYYLLKEPQITEVFANTASVTQSNPKRLKSSIPKCPMMSRHNTLNQFSSIKRSNGCKRARKSLRTITFILGAFIVCWTPWHIVVIISNYCEVCTKSPIYIHLYLFVYYMCYMNSPINPICYAMANQQFQKAFTRVGDVAPRASVLPLYCRQHLPDEARQPVHTNHQAIAQPV
ncbi:hypothetical protein GJ496_001783 [Pomphorhynchus laevis]|nr:hypothetical protein GJ496_001783 [Pomphorhynchus laevis]